jgi:DNA-directed RNA polymerase specialized sigma24 family protein
MPETAAPTPNPAHVKLRDFLLSLYRGGAIREPPALLHRLAANVLRDCTGGRAAPREQVEDLAQELLVKVLQLRARHPVPPFDHSNPAKTVGWVRVTLRSLAIDGNPYWDTQRALREVVRKALAGGLPEAKGFPSQLETNGRFVRGLVAAACAELVAGRFAPDVAVLTRTLMAEYAYGSLIAELTDVEALEERAQHPQVSELEEREVARVVVNTFLAEAGAEGRELLTRRSLGLQEMARMYGVALATIHARYSRVVALLRDIAQRVGATVCAMSQALDELLAV